MLTHRLRRDRAAELHGWDAAWGSRYGWRVLEPNASPEFDVDAVEVTRGSLVEGRHRARVAVVYPDGEVWSAGDSEAMMFPRSALKPLQAIAMVQSGLDLEGAELALAAASHQGEAYHLARVASILKRSGLSESDLQTPPAHPTGDAAWIEWVAAGQRAEPIAHECSGKHAAMLRTCILAGWSISGYRMPGHPLQQTIREVISEYTEQPVGDPAVDGCGAPAFSIPLSGLARAFGKLAAARSGPAWQVAEAFRQFPAYASGTGASDLAVHRAVPGIVCKRGAEAVFAAGLPDGTGVAVKLSDGMGRGVVELTATILASLGVETPELAALATGSVLGGGGPAGRIQLSPSLTLPPNRLPA